MGREAGAMTTHWEYLKIQEARVSAEWLNAFGIDGWELTAVVQESPAVTVYWLKRPLPAPPEAG